ncbi:MAG: ribonuclease III [Clostridia bacterium]|nr:ribonuclease III [Clostridia bacterium]
MPANTAESVYPVSPALLEDTIGYHFKNSQLLKEALTHSSYANELRSKGITAVCNERSEFLGDSVLSIITSEYLFSTFRTLPEGSLTKMRASIVCEDACCRYADDIHLGDYLMLGRGEELNHGRSRKSILADAFEALLAAIYLDAGKEEAARFLLPYVKKEAAMLKNGRTKDYKTLLQQITQQRPGEILEYVLIGQTGPDHKKVFETEARLNSNIIGRGKGATKRESEQMAAYQALILFGEEQPEEE